MSEINLNIFIESLTHSLGENFLPFLGKLIWILLILITYKHIIKFINKTSKSILEKNKVEPLLKSFLLSLINGVAYIFIFFLFISVIGFKATSLITILGTAGIAIGLALQGSLSNLAGGVLILFFKPFLKGDYIESSGISGVVDNIQILYTTLLTFDNKKIIIPNGQLANSSVVNLSTNNERRVDLTVSVSYDTDINLVKETLKDIANSHDKIIHSKNYIIRLANINASSLDFAFKVWTKNSDYWDVYSNLNETIVNVFREKNIEIPYNKLDIYNKIS